MDSLKFLGKPAPKAFIIDGVINSRIRAMHLEGAIKEASELLQHGTECWPYSLKEQRWIWHRQEENEKENRGISSKFIAFLLRKTIGERT